MEIWVESLTIFTHLELYRTKLSQVQGKFESWGPTRFRTSIGSFSYLPDSYPEAMSVR